MPYEHNHRRKLSRIIPAWALVLLLALTGAGSVSYSDGPQSSDSSSHFGFGPLSCGGCPSKVFTKHFLAQPGEYKLIVWAEGVGNAKIILNGQVIFGPANLPDNDPGVALVELLSHNTLKVKVWDNGPECRLWFEFIRLPTIPPQPDPEPEPQPAPSPCDPCAPPAPAPQPAPSPCNPCAPPAPAPAPQPAPAPCTTCAPPAPSPPCAGPCGGGSSTATVNQLNAGHGSGRNNLAVVEGVPAWYGRTIVNQVNAGNGDYRDNIAEVSGGGGFSTINQLNAGDGDHRGNMASTSSSSSSGCGPAGCATINQVNIGNGDDRFNLASMLWDW